MEEWRDIKGYEGYYQISNFGRVKSLPRDVGSNRCKNEIIMKTSLDKDGYEHLNEYFLTLRNGMINYLVKQINDVETAYEESYKRNVNTLKLVTIFVDNYNDDTVMKDNIIHMNCFNYAKCTLSTEVKEVIKFYNEYCVLKEKSNNSNNKVECI